ncbi:MAG: adenylyl-sulfate kinase [Betaproteobacteria bacterium HGW-Betaproteobacteria-2]|nr:MAG: adenylyl-sulfate kinase [Betaproteobacteria bacterium HGW-Betaproteobacteria-2]
MQNIVWHNTQVSKLDRASLKQQKPFVIWLTGLSGSGKSTLANALDAYFHEQRYHSYMLDGDNVRHGLNKDLGFDQKSRVENIRRIGEVSKLMVDAGLIVITAFISPYRSDRDMVREMFPADEFIEVYLDAALAVCEQRDPKGLYKKAREGKITDFTGIDSPYEAPLNPEIVLSSDKQDVEQELLTVVHYLEAKKLLAT